MNKLTEYIKHLEDLKDEEGKTKQTANENTTTSTSGFQTREQSVKGTKKKEQDQNPWNVKWAIE